MESRSRPANTSRSSSSSCRDHRRIIYTLSADERWTLIRLSSVRLLAPIEEFRQLEHSCDAVSQDARADQIMLEAATYSRDVSSWSDLSDHTGTTRYRRRRYRSRHVRRAR
jgi:hypothetical protein